MNKFENKQKKAYLIFFSCAVILIVFLIFICAGGFNGSKISNTQSAATATSHSQAGYITFPPSPSASVSNSPTAAVPSQTTNNSDSPVSSNPIYPEQKAVLQFMGDIVLHSSVLSSAEPEGYIFDSYFDNIKKYINGDAVFANLEGVIEGDQNYSGYPLFNYPANIASALKNVGITDVITANDRAFDKLASGLVSTRKNLENFELGAIGTYTSAEQAALPYIKDVNGIKLGVIAYSDGTNDMQQHMPEEYRAFAMKMIDWNDLDKTMENINSDISAARSAGAELVILSLHWGTEYTFKQSDEQKTLAQRILESGADIIMGTRPHMVQPITVKNIQINGIDKKIAVMYSLGNFFADQTDLSQERTQAGIIVNIEISRNVYTNQVEIGDIQYIPTYVYKYNSEENQNSYSILAANEYSASEDMPKIFSSQEEWTKCKNAEKLIEQTVGDKVTKVTSE